MKTFITIRNFTICAFVLFLTNINAQVTGVKYLLEYNPSNDYFDCILVIDGGTAKSVLERTQFPSQVSLAVPVGSEFRVIDNFMPLVGNQNFTSTRPVEWDIFSKVLKPKASVRFDFYSIKPDLKDEAHYNELQLGDSIKLFSIKFDTLVGCADGIRLFINGSDPNENADGFMNQDFSQQFSIGSGANIYIENAIISYPNIAGKDENACKGQSLTLSPTPASKGKWYLPSGNADGAKLDNTGLSTDKINFPLNAKLGIYTVIYADSNYYDMKCITITQPEATITVDSVSCDGGFMKLIANGNGSYAWSPTGGNNKSIRPLANTNYTLTVTDQYGCTATSSIAVKTITDIIVPGKNLCIGVNYTLPDLASATWDSLLFDGKWDTTNDPIATVTQEGIVTPSSQGSVAFIFSYGDCYVVTNDFTVNPKPVITLNGAESICAGASISFTSSSPGQWISSNPNILVINNQGLATGLNPGTATISFLQNNSGCMSEPKTITVKQKPSVAIIGPRNICVGNETQLTPQSGGIWTSDNIIVASVDNTGLVTGLAAGSVQFRFLADNGCFSDLTPIVTVNPIPVVTILGSDHICELGGTTQLSPTTGGTWTSSSPLVATVNNSGFVTGLYPGVVTAIFTSSIGCGSAISPPITVVAKPNISILGPDKICIGNTSQMTATVTGNWTSNAPNIASITPNGIITGLSAGDATFTFTGTPTVCSSVISPIIKILPLPDISTTPLNLCVGSTFTYSPTPNGTWDVFPLGIISINNHTFDALSEGSTKIIFTAANTGCKSDSILTTVNALPIINVVGNDTICVGSTTTLTPNSGGTWTSSTLPIATIDNFGIVTGLAQGNVTFTYVNTISGCAATSPNIHIAPSPIVTTEALEVCEGSQLPLISTPSGSWQAFPDSIILVQDSIFVPISTGTTFLVFTSSVNGCQSDTLSITINPTPQILLTGNDSICVGSTTTFSASIPGTWAGSNFTIADITNNGTVTGLAAGTVFFEFSSTDGCAASSQNITVNAPPNISISIENNQLLTANVANMYAWYDCTNNQLVAQTTEPNFSPSVNGSYYVISNDGICNSQSACVDFVLVGTSDIKAENVKIIPNPASTQINISTSLPINNVVLKNSLGQTVMTSSQTNIDVANLSAGIYMVIIETHQGTISKPVIIVR